MLGGTEARAVVVVVAIVRASGGDDGNEDGTGRHGGCVDGLVVMDTYGGGEGSGRFRARLVSFGVVGGSGQWCRVVVLSCLVGAEVLFGSLTKQQRLVAVVTDKVLAGTTD